MLDLTSHDKAQYYSIRIEKHLDWHKFIFKKLASLDCFILSILELGLKAKHSLYGTNVDFSPLYWSLFFNISFSLDKKSNISRSTPQSSSVKATGGGSEAVHVVDVQMSAHMAHSHWLTCMMNGVWCQRKDGEQTWRALIGCPPWTSKV